MRRTLAAFVLFALAPRAASAAPPSAPSVARCLDASEEGQRLRDEGQLSRARPLFETCASTACPNVVRQNCVTWLEGVQQSMPTFVISVRDDDGSDVVDARIAIDGRLVEANRAGRPIDVDPGSHVVKVTSPRHRAFEQQIIAVNGEKNRALRIVLDLERGTTPAPAPSPSPAPSRGPEESRPVPALTYVLGGVGVVAAGFSLGFGLSARSGISDLEGAPCAATKTCAQDDVDSVRSRIIVADVFFGVAVASLVAAGIVWALR